MTDDEKLEAKYQAAFNSFLEKVKADSTISAAYLFGSLARGDLWEKSDLDVFLVAKDEGREEHVFALIEDDITFHCNVYSRSRFRHIHERLLRGSVSHQIFTSGKLVYTLDESLYDYFKDVAFVGERDREYLVMRCGIEALAEIHDVQKALFAHQDPLSAFIWLLEVVKRLANVEIVSRAETIQREALQQALYLNPQAFKKLVINLINGDKDLATIHKQLDLAEIYLIERGETIFNPLLAFLADRGEAVGAEEISRHFDARLLMESGDFRLIGACEWLVERGVIQKLVAPVKLTLRSRVTVDEPAYFYDGGRGNA